LHFIPIADFNILYQHFSSFYICTLQVLA